MTRRVLRGSVAGVRLRNEQVRKSAMNGAREVPKIFERFSCGWVGGGSG
jgi:hypothetical protein